MSVPNQCCAEGRWRMWRRSMVIGLWWAISGARSAASAMMTTIPIPRRARLSRRNLSRCLGSSIFLLSLRRGVAQLRRRVRRLASPSAVLPKVLRRSDPHPMLQTRRKTCHDRVDVAIHVSGTFCLDPLQDDPKSPVGFSKRDHEDDRHPESQGEYRGSTRRFRRASEERHKGRGQAKHTLIGDESNRTARTEGPRRSFHRFGVVYDSDPHLFAGVIDVGVKQGVCHSAYDRVERDSAGSDVSASQFPITNMSRDHHRASSLRHHLVELLPPLDGLDEVLQTVLTERAEQCRFDERPPEMLVRFAGERDDLLVGELRKRCRYLLLDNTLSNSERPITESAKLFPNFAGGIPTECAQRADRRAHRVIFGAMGEGGFRLRLARP